jgi:hypothetical protein
MNNGVARRKLFFNHFELLNLNPDKPEPKKIGFIFTTKLTKEKKNKIYNLRDLRVLRGVIKLFLP